jgi:hypothetical protein
MASDVTITGSDIVISVDGTKIYPAGTTPPLPPLPPVPARNPVIGSNAGIMWGANGHPVQGGGPYAPMPLPEHFALLSSMGLRDYRIDLYEAEDHSIDLLQRLIVEGAKHRISILPCVIPDYQSYASENEAYEAAKILARTYASRFPGVPVWEWGNEYELWPNAQKPGTQGSVIDDYDWGLFCLARGTYRGMLDGMRDGNATAKGMINTSGHGHWGWTDQLWADGVHWDITGEHFYSAEGTVSIEHLYLMVGETNKLQLLKDRYARPIFITEFNYWCRDGSDGEKPQMAAYLASAMAEYDGFAKKYGLERVHIYELLDEPQAPGREGLLGLVTSDQLNIAGNAVRDYLREHPSIVYQPVSPAAARSRSMPSSGEPVTARQRRRA